MIYQKAEVSRQKSVDRSQKPEAGFTMIELMITMVIFVLAITASSQIFTKLVTQFKQQSKIAETNIEGIVGLELLRQDIEHAGLGLPWNISGVAYTEATDATYNDAPGDPPRAFISGNSALANGADYLVIKSASSATSSAGGKNTRLTSDGNVRTWSSTTDDLGGTDRVIVISPGSSDSNSRALVVSGGSYNASLNNVSSFAPLDEMDVRLVYGISPANTTNALRAPFNRADYYLSAANVPTRCANGTSVLYRATLNHETGDLDEMPVLDCVADLQVIFIDNNGVPHNDLSFTDALPDGNGNGVIDSSETRDQLREVNVYILAQEGQKDPTFTFNNYTAGGTSVRVGSSAVFGRDLDLAAAGITDYANYRWKLYSIFVQTNNLR
jgi:prepilin-type N-terminal cleavage/methylation domain-containing protein